MQEKGIKIKNNHSSNGNPAIINPTVYRVSNHQTPRWVNHTSQAIKNIPTIIDAFKKGANARSNRIRLSNEAIKQINTVKNRIRE